MDRRTLLKSSGLFMGALGLSTLASRAAIAAPAQAATQGSAVFIPSAKTPLLLNFNENSLGMSPKAQAAIINELPAAFRYPDDARAALISTLAKGNGLSDKQITLGNGSSEVIQMAIHAYCGKGTQLVCPDPTFNYAELYAEPMGTTITKVKLQKDTLAIDLKAMRAATEKFAGVSVVYLCNPNNPTATITPAADIEAWINSAPERVFFIVDEAYHEYVTDPRYASAARLVQAGKKNLIVARTFSKIYALAGLRIGYGLAAPEIIARLDTWASIDNTNLPAAIAANASLQDTAFIRQSLSTTAQSRKIVTQALDELKLAYLPSHANFIFHRVNSSSAAYRENMKKLHIMVGRPFDHTDGWNRLTLGTPAEMQAFVKALKTLRQQNLA
ncbi:pyridoxal phosphate-dependent aminotransferase [Craterilacuibacter sinensis]|uniref:Putative 8-amino-7-oxononanoate synthase n=1 Tax=Craterilacuibacter sinensis TaxID=2686017 RepID=A0A845BSJ8_9NEIS|nr:histidinol-phosphate transaminase [Craterilacuibacter sinensis]MXR37166.1 aminotransferase class I/II-fold pyridoxal phosphate-dependent enzyme [Craterilacuibacter sinensis]RQW28932.1 aminotransferase class I/II-fold pyridoxal phosphate-dependent enzyme [Rhodobacteraceae bacterium CH30]